MSALLIQSVEYWAFVPTVVGLSPKFDANFYAVFYIDQFTLLKLALGVVV